MNPSTFIILGANGQLGKALVKQYPQARAVDVNELDITDNDSLNKFDWSGIKVILNAAAYTNVDGAETEDGRELAWKVNATPLETLSQIATKNNITLVHISTDYVFDGKQSMHLETEDFSPLNVYGSSKAAGDVAVALTPKHFIVRTSWVIGDGKNFVRTMLDLAKKSAEPSVVADQFGRPTFTTELVRAIDYLLQNNAASGTYNVTNDGEVVSWADLTREIFKEAKADLAVKDTSTDQYNAGKKNIAKRPVHSELSLDKIHSIGFKSKDWKDDLKIYVEKEMNA